MALCRLCHWSFDEGLMSVGASYEVLVSRRVRMDQNMPGHMLTLADRPIFRPAKKSFWPAKGNLGRTPKAHLQELAEYAENILD